MRQKERKKRKEKSQEIEERIEEKKRKVNGLEKERDGKGQCEEPD